MDRRHGYSDTKDRHLARLKRIEGQVRGVHRMIDEDQYCIDILTQIAAVSSALESVGLSLLDEHLRHCVAGAIAADSSGAEAELKLDEAMQAIKRLVKS